jgi:DNA-binding NarL/FixJ family response regulator
MKQAPIHLKAVCTPIRIIIADDHPIFIDGLKTLLKKVHLLGIECAGEASNGKELIEQVEKLKPDIVFTDIQMPQMDGIAATKIIKAKFPDIKVIALSGFNETGLILDMIEAGASGYLLKNTSKKELFQSIQAVIDGKTYYCTESAEKLSEYIKLEKQPNKKDQLTASDKQIIKLVCQGRINKEIASQLKLSKRTVENYREKIMEKIEVSNIMELAMYAVKNNIYIP